MTARVLLLGGTGDALAIARTLGSQHVYSLAGLGRVPADLACAVRVGGFGGPQGLARFLADEGIALVFDATHPYAAQISANAARACEAAHVLYWALRRAPWQPQPGDDWRMVGDWAGVSEAIAPFARPLFTLGREPLAHLDEVPPQQHWTIRCLDAHPGHARARVIDARGPFTPEGERALFTEARIDVVVSKNSGGAATEAKLAVARDMSLPVVMMRRPPLPGAQRELASAREAIEAIDHAIQRSFNA
ncbi:cobalt-precorrin-6A reductase [Paraburkholderia lycopersici]|uniref:Precorrin-6A/cobalt-precorrin-6A reductase n=1 Tax=Paraburkholderia lycopersici TaxID=416944 RepID=A0A1G7AIQ6_9BURK|nr:cobalt-precorrin-6A reductase [Paraburkholderia lycopersici]SDE14610.1 precorrin-6A/cobalt-precorrin-6A reductase [Paraburkholderia lycopersici]